MQKMIVTGFVGGDPDEKVTASGKKITSFSIGVNTKKGDEKFTCWYKINCWEDKFSRVLPYIKKGSMLTVMGNFNIPTSYTNKLGHDKIDLSISCESIDFIPMPKPVEDASEKIISKFNNDAISSRQNEIKSMMDTSDGLDMDLGF